MELCFVVPRSQIASSIRKMLINMNKYELHGTLEIPNPRQAPLYLTAQASRVLVTMATIEVSSRHANTCGVTCDSQGSAADAADAIPANVGEYAGGPCMMYAITGSCGPASPEAPDPRDSELRTERDLELSCGREVDC